MITLAKAMAALDWCWISEIAPGDVNFSNLMQYPIAFFRLGFLVSHRIFLSLKLNHGF
jgi:hypothetical protein